MDGLFYFSQLLTSFTDVREGAGERWMTLLDSRIPRATSAAPGGNSSREYTSFPKRWPFVSYIDWLETKVHLRYSGYAMG